MPSPLESIAVCNRLEWETISRYRSRRQNVCRWWFTLAILRKLPRWIKSAGLEEHYRNETWNWTIRVFLCTFECHPLSGRTLYRSSRWRRSTVFCLRRQREHSLAILFVHHGFISTWIECSLREEEEEVLLAIETQRWFLLWTVGHQHRRTWIEAERWQAWYCRWFWLPPQRIERHAGRREVTWYVLHDFDWSGNTHLQTFGTIDGTQWTKYTKYSQNLHHWHGTIFNHHGYQRDGHNDNIQNVESIATEGARMQNQPIGNDLEVPIAFTSPFAEILTFKQISTVNTAVKK